MRRITMLNDKVRYQCGECGRTHDTESQATLCEGFHANGVVRGSSVIVDAPPSQPFRVYDTFTDGCGDLRPSPEVTFVSTMPEPATGITDHAAASAEALRKIVKRLEDGTAPEDIGSEVVLLGRMMARRT